MTTKAELRKHFAKSHYNVGGGEPAVEGRTGNQEQITNSHQHQAKDLSEEQLLAQYFGRQQFQMQSAKPEEGDLLPKGEQPDENHLVVKPDLDHLISTRPQQNHLHTFPKPDIDHLLSQRHAHPGSAHIDQLLGRGAYPGHMGGVAHSQHAGMQALWPGMPPTHPVEGRVNLHKLKQNM